MCGFVAIINSKAETVCSNVVERMLLPITHRGPDDSGIAIERQVGLGFRRLSILDLSPQGHQPMNSADGCYTVVFNGEIYNYIELREQLEAMGHRFHSSGDTEVLLAAYQHWGRGCVERFNGMWAFVIYDRARKIVFGSRDRFGIKPLFRWQGDRQMLFASEIKAIRASGLYRGGMNPRVCAAYLYESRLDETNETFFEGIVQLPPAHCFELTLDDGQYREWPFWSLEHLIAEPHPHAAEEFAQAFEDSMRLHMRSDVPLGVNLSGGLDSTAILCEAARIRARDGADTPLLAFSYQDEMFDESHYIKDTLAQTGARLVKMELSPQQLWDSIPKVLAAQDEPVHSMSAMIGYHLAALARQHGVKVVLNGQGADEVLAGYDSYFYVRWLELMRQGRAWTAWQEVRDYTAAHGGEAGQRFAALLKPTITAPLKEWLTSYAARRAEKQRVASARSRPWLSPDLAAQLAPLQPQVLTDLHTVLITSIRQAPLPLYLRVEDRNSMAHSVESRLPFLDHRLVNLAFRLDPEWNIRGPWNKYVLREAMRGRIPESVRSRVDKMGFPNSSGEWLRGPLKTQLLDVLSDPGFKASPLFRHAEFERMTRQHLSGEATHTGNLLTAVQIHIWQQQQGIPA
ncbi:MAG: asparagine synthase (glutamine-hydrolyzing) [Polaromonas sp.]